MYLHNMHFVVCNHLLGRANDMERIAVIYYLMSRFLSSFGRTIISNPTVKLRILVRESSDNGNRDGSFYHTSGFESHPLTGYFRNKE
mgnify:CR=1 FL=1